MNEKTKQMLTLVATFVGITAPFLVDLLIPNRVSTGEISGRFFAEVLIIPADYVFAIWAPIYVGLLAFAVYQALPTQRDNPRFAKTRLWLTASALLNAGWIVAFNSLQFNLSVVLIVGMLATALRMHRTLEIGETKVSRLERYLRIPFSLYAGWLTVATIVNLAGALEVAGWNALGLSYSIWDVVMLLIATAIGLLTRLRWHDPIYGVVFVWAFVGIIVARVSVVPVAVTAGILALVFLASLLRPLANPLTRTVQS